MALARRGRVHERFGFALPWSAVRELTRATFREAMLKLRRDGDRALDDDATLLLMARAVLRGPTDADRASYQIAMTVCE